MPSCSVFWCKKTSQKSNLETDGITFHRFPQGAVYRRKWTEACNRPNNWIPKYTSCMCSRHFESSEFKKTDTHVRLKEDAVPRLLLQKDELQRIDSAPVYKPVTPKRAPNNIVSTPVRINSQTAKSNVQKPAEACQQYEKATASEAYTNKEESKKENVNNAFEQLQIFLKPLLPNLDENKSVFVILVNNEQKNPIDYNSEVEVLRKKLARKTELAELRLRKLAAVSASRHRLLKKNKTLLELIDQLKKNNLYKGTS